MNDGLDDLVVVFLFHVGGFELVKTGFEDRVQDAVTVGPSPHDARVVAQAVGQRLLVQNHGFDVSQRNGGGVVLADPKRGQREHVAGALDLPGKTYFWISPHIYLGEGVITKEDDFLF